MAAAAVRRFQPEVRAAWRPVLGKSRGNGCLVLWGYKYPEFHGQRSRETEEIEDFAGSLQVAYVKLQAAGSFLLLLLFLF